MNTDIVKIGITKIAGLFSTCVSYFVGRRQKLDEALLTKKIEMAQEISELLQKVHSQYCTIEALWDSNFSQVDFNEAIDGFDRCPIYDEDRERINDAQESAVKLRELHCKSAIYLDSKFRALLAQYLNLYQFTFRHDGSGYSNNQSENFFKNLKATSKRRSALYSKLERQFAKLVK